MSAVRRLREEEAGFSLTELLSAMVIGSVVLYALMQVFITGVTNSAKVSDRVDTAQRARVAMDRVTTLLGAQMCLDPVTPPLTDAQNDQLTFYANLGTVSAFTEQYRLRYDAPTKRLVEEQFDPTVDAANDDALTYGTTPTRTRVIATDVVPARVAGVDQPFFRYYAFNQVDGTIASTPLTAPLSATDRGQAVRVAAEFQLQSTRTHKLDGRQTAIDGQAIVASAEADSPAKGVNC